MQFPVPQFENVENKIIGPLTFAQFIYLLGGAGLSYILLRILPTPINLLLIGPLVALSLALAFYRINSRPFIVILEAAFFYSIRKKLYLWSHKQPKQRTTQKKEEEQETLVEMPSITNSKMKELAWNLDINERIERTAPTTKQVRASDNVLNSI